MNDQVYWVWFSMLNRISPQMKISLIRQYENPYNLWTFFKKEHNPADISPGAYRDLVSDELKKKSYRTLKRTLDLGIGIISYNDKDYPPLLKQIPEIWVSKIPPLFETLPSSRKPIGSLWNLRTETANTPRWKIGPPKWRV